MFDAEDFSADEKFSEESVRDAAMKLINDPAQAEKLLVTVSAEWDRKEERMSGAINSTNVYRSRNSSDHIITVQLRVESWDKDAEEVVAEASKVLAWRADARKAAAIAEKQAKIAAMEAELEELRNS